MYTGFCLSPTRDSGVQQDRDERGGHISGAEENQDYLLVLRRGGGDVLSPSPHGYNTRNSPDTYQGGRCRRRCNGDIRGVFSKVTEFGGMPGRHITNKGGKPGRLREHFMYQNCKAEVKIILERPVVATSSLRHHMDITHGIVLTHTRGVDVGGGVTEIYVVYFPRLLNLVACPVDILPTRGENQGDSGNTSCIGAVRRR